MMDFVFRAISLVSIPLMGLAIWQMIRLIGREQRLGLTSPVLGLVLSPVMLAVNLIFMGRMYSAWLAPLLLALGLGFGLAWGQTNRIYVKNNALFGKRSVLHLIFWGLSYAITQLLATFAPAAVVAGGLAAMFFSAGSSVGTNLNLVTRQLRMRGSLSSILPAPLSLPERNPRKSTPAIGFKGHLPR